MKRLATIALALCAACNGGGNSDDFGDAGACIEVRADIPVEINRDIDILFVVDGSVSMLDRLDTLETNVGRFANVLENIEGGLPSVHIGLVSADVQQHGGALLAPKPECGIDGAFLSDLGYIGGQRDDNYQGAFADAFACMFGSVPVGGTLEEPLDAARRALDGSNSANDGFVRDYAFLYIVFITDEDDCSGGAALAVGDDEARSAYRCFADGVRCDQPADALGVHTGCVARDDPTALARIDRLADDIRGLKPDPSMVMVSSLIAGADPVVAASSAGPVLEPACTAQTMEWPAVRMRDFLAQFPQRNSTTDVCGDDWADALILVAEMLRKLLFQPCVDIRADLEPDAPGVQSECVVSEVRGDEERILPMCSGPEPPIDERPCWHLYETEQCDDSVGFEVYRWRETVLSGTRVEVRCFGGCY